MTFRSLSRTIEKRARDLTKGNENNNKLNRAFARFLAECFPEGGGLNFEISVSNGRITIQTPNKTVANELILKMSDLARVFKEENINSDQIIIR